MDPVRLEYFAIALVLILYVVLPLVVLYYLIELGIWLYHKYQRVKNEEMLTPLGKDDFDFPDEPKRARRKHRR